MLADPRWRRGLRRYTFRFLNPVGDVTYTRLPEMVDDDAAMDFADFLCASGVTAEVWRLVGTTASKLH